MTPSDYDVDILMAAQSAVNEDWTAAKISDQLKHLAAKHNVKLADVKKDFAPQLKGTKIMSEMGSEEEGPQGATCPIRNYIIGQLQTAGPDAWVHKIAVNGRGTIISNAANIETVITHWHEVAGVFAYNEWTGAVVLVASPPWAKTDGWKTRDITDLDLTQALCWMQRNLTPNAGIEAVDAGIKAAAQSRTVDPLKDYFGALQWDGVHRLDELPTRLGVEDKAAANLARKTLRWWLVSGVARVFEPGVKVDAMPVLVGAQGVGKSSFVRELSPDPEWFTDTLDHEARNARDELLKLRTAFLVEISEFDRFRNKGAAALKSFISAQVDSYRAPYARVSETRPRRCIFAGTSNVWEVLGDTTGGRRFWPIPVGEVDLDWIIGNRDMIWAEACAAYDAGEAWWPDKTDEETIADLKETQTEATDVDPWMEEVAGWIAGEWDTVVKGERMMAEMPNIPKRGERMKQVYVADVLRNAVGVVGAHQTGIDARRVRDCLTALGYKRGEKHKVKGKLWVKTPD